MQRQLPRPRLAAQPRGLVQSRMRGKAGGGRRRGRGRPVDRGRRSLTTSPACGYGSGGPSSTGARSAGQASPRRWSPRVFALGGGARRSPTRRGRSMRTPRRRPASLHDVQSGSNGRMHTRLRRRNRALPRASRCRRGRQLRLEGDLPRRRAAMTGHGASARPTGSRHSRRPPSGAGSEPEPPPSVEGTGQRRIRREGARQKPLARRKAPPPGPKPAPATPTEVVTAPVSATTEISGLSLTLDAVLVLNTGRPHIAQVGFVFDASHAGRVRIALTRRVRTHHGRHGRVSPVSRSVYVGAGRTSRRLAGGAALRSGLYRLTVTPAGGVTRSLLFQIG